MFKIQSKMIKIQNLKKIYNGNTVLDIDDLGVAKGELIGLVGNNGAGKTTLLRLILDLIQADDGFVESNGQKVNESETWRNIPAVTSTADSSSTSSPLRNTSISSLMSITSTMRPCRSDWLSLRALCTMKSWEPRSISVISLRATDRRLASSER